MILAIAVIYAWSATAWAANWLEPESAPVKLLLVGLMFASLLMSVASPTATHAWCSGGSR